MGQVIHNTQRAPFAAIVGGVRRFWSDSLFGPRGPNLVTCYALDITVTATANTDFTLNLPAGCSILEIVSYTTTAFGAQTAANLTAGTAAGGEQVVAAVNIKSAARVVHTVVSSASASSWPINQPLHVRLTQTGTASATGVARVLVTVRHGV